MRPIFGLVLLVVVAAAAFLAWPAFRGYEDRNRAERARYDVEEIRAALVRFYEDNAFFPLWVRNQPGESTTLVRADLLVSKGDPPDAPAGSTWADGLVGTLDDLLIANGPSYALKQDPDGPGWNGPYLAVSPGADPWNHRYVVNIGSIPSADAAAGSKYAVWVLSAGPNGKIETAYQQAISSAVLGGDDIGVRVQ